MGRRGDEEGEREEPRGGQGEERWSARRRPGHAEAGVAAARGRGEVEREAAAESAAWKTKTASHRWPTASRGRARRCPVHGGGGGGGGARVLGEVLNFPSLFFSLWVSTRLK